MNDDNIKINELNANTGTISVEGDNLGQLANLLRTASVDNPSLSAERILFDIGDSALEITASDGDVVVREVDE